MNDSIAQSERPGYSGQVFGQQPHVADRDFSALLQDNYIVTDMRRGEPDVGRPLPGTWARMSDDDVRAAGMDPELLHDAKSGFDASLYRDADGAVVLAFTGSDEGQDWTTNFRQGLGFDDPQYGRAVTLAREARHAFGDDLVLTGHSLGGGLAATAAIVTDTPAVTFNAAGVHDRTLERHGLDADEAKAYAAEGLVRSYTVKNEILTHLQEDSFPLKYAMPDAPGHRIELPDPDPLSFFQRLIPGRMLAHRVDLHFIDTVMEAQDIANLDVRTHTAPRRASGNDEATSNQLLRDAMTHLAPQRRQLGLEDDERLLNATAGLALQASRDGLRGIDDVVPSTRQGVIAISGDKGDPRHQLSLADIDAYAITPARESAARLQEEQQTLAQATTQPLEQPRMSLG